MRGARVIVVGGSLGGLTTACVLRDAGHDVTVHERSPDPLEQRGAGIGLLAATSRYLVERAGIALDDMSIATDFIRHLDRGGAVLHETAHGYRFTSWNAVYRILSDSWGDDRYVPGSELVDFAQDGDGVVVRFADGSSEPADLLVCADGIGSTARAKLQPEARTRYAGYVAWRGLVPERDLPARTIAALADAITYHVGAASHLLAYPIPGPDGGVHPGDRRLNFVWYRNRAAGDELDDLLLDADGVQREFSVPPGKLAARHDAEARASAADRLPDLLAGLVAHAPQLFLQVIADMEVERMAFGRVCLLGDAAFVARPHAAAGTAKAAADAWALADALARADDVASALAAWEPGQLQLGRQLVERTRRIGDRFQVDDSWTPGDPDLFFGLYRPGD